jgi:hypothetical protein
MEIQPADSAGWRQTVQHIICCCEVLARQRYNVFGKLIVEPNDISTASVRDLLSLHMRYRVTESVLNGVFRAAQYAYGCGASGA